MPKDPQANPHANRHVHANNVRSISLSRIDDRLPIRKIHSLHLCALHRISDVSRALYYLSAETNCVYLGIRVLVLAVQRLILLSRRVNVFTRLWCAAATWTPVHVVVRLTSNVVWQMNKHMWLNFFVFDLWILVSHSSNFVSGVAQFPVKNWRTVDDVVSYYFLHFSNSCFVIHRSGDFRFLGLYN